MIEFDKTISESEFRSGYLNLTDDRGQRYGPQFGLEHRTRIAVKDTSGGVTFTQMHNTNQLWGMLRNWFDEDDITPGARIQVRFDPTERHEGMPVVHLVQEAPGAQVPSTPPDLADTAKPYASEIPLRLERQLEDFLAANPSQIEPGLTLFKDQDGHSGQQYPTDVGVIDLLCKRSNGELLVVELKRSQASDGVVGQISRYIGWVKKHLANGTPVSGLILSHEADESLKYAVYALPPLALKYFKLKLELVPEDEL